MQLNRSSLKSTAAYNANGLSPQQLVLIALIGPYFLRNPTPVVTTMVSKCRGCRQVRRFSWRCLAAQTFYIKTVDFASKFKLRSFTQRKITNYVISTLYLKLNDKVWNTSLIINSVAIWILCIHHYLLHCTNVDYLFICVKLK